MRDSDKCTSLKMAFSTMAFLRLGCIVLFYTVCVSAFKDNFASSSQLSIHPSENLLPSFEDELKLFEEELDNGVAFKSGKSRQKRYLYFNTESLVDVGFLIVIPITVVLPPMTNLFNTWRRKRSVDNLNSNITTEDSPFIQEMTNRITSYFELIDIPETSCQLRAMCEFSADHNKYFPLSDIFIDKLRHRNVVSEYEKSHLNSTSTDQKLFGALTDAADTGVVYGSRKCEEIYQQTCKYSMHQLLDMSKLKFWSKIKTALKLKFDDVSEYSIQI